MAFEAVVVPDGKPLTGIIQDVGGAVHNVRSLRYWLPSDHRQSILDAIDDLPEEGGTILIPPGDYLIDATMSVERSDVRIYGYGARLVVNSWEPNGVFLLHFEGTDSDLLTGCVVEGLTFYDPEPQSVENDQSHGCLMEYTDGAVIRHCKFIDIGDEAADLVRSVSGIIEFCDFNGVASIDSLGSAISFTSSRHSIARFNRIRGSSQGNAVRVEAVEATLPIHDLMVHDNVVYDWDSPASAAMQVIGGSNVNGDVFERISFVRNRFIDVPKSAITLASTIEGITIEDVRITDNVVSGGGTEADTGGGVHRAAIQVGQRTSGVVIDDNDIRNWGDSQGHHGILLRAAPCIVRKNTIVGVADSGIYEQDATDGSVIEANVIRDNGALGGVGSRSGIHANTNTLVRGNTCTGSANRGIRLAGSGAIAEANDVSGNVIGIRYENGTIGRRNRVRGNTTGIQLVDTDPSVIDDELVGNTTPASVTASASERRFTTGQLVTEKADIATIANGNTSITVTHGVTANPTAAHIQVTPLTDLGSATKWWMERTNNTQFVIHVDVDPGEDIDFAWMVIIR